MKHKPSNPFILAGYYAPQYFCDRKKEYEDMEEAVKNERNITLYSLRRQGKTALIKHLFYYMEKEKQYDTIYVDLFPSETLKDFAKRMADAVVQKYGNILKKGITKTMQDLIKNIGASMEFDPVTGMPSIKLHYNDDNKIKLSIRHVLSFLLNHRHKVIIALDEFQQITRYHEKNTEAYMRSLIQEYPSIRFIFSGSHRNIMLSMFSDQGKPFYRSTQLLELKTIDKEDYTKFIMHHFKKAAKSITQNHIAEIFDWTRMQTYYVQLVCNRLYSETNKVNTDIIHDIFIKILQEEQTIFTNYRNMLTQIQWDVLVAIAKDSPVQEPTSGHFLRKHGISSPSTMDTTLKALGKKGMIIRMDDQYIVHDTLLMRWIQYNVADNFL